MKRYLWIITLVVLPMIAASRVHAQIAIQNTEPLAFGSFVAGNGGTVKIDVNNARTSSGGVTLIPWNAGQAAKFTITGTSNTTYFVELPPNNFVKLTGPGGEMIVGEFTSTPSGAGGQLGAGGSQTLTVGAVLQVNNGQVAGEYSGSFSVTVDYN